MSLHYKHSDLLTYLLTYLLTQNDTAQLAESVYTLLAVGISSGCHLLSWLARAVLWAPPVFFSELMMQLIGNRGIDTCVGIR